MHDIALQYSGTNYFLTVNDGFSKFPSVTHVHVTDVKAITAAFYKMLTTENPRHYRRLQTDKGKKFFNSDFLGSMKRNSIQHFASESEQTAAVMEQYNRTIKTRISPYLSDRGTVRWVDAIQDLMEA